MENLDSTRFRYFARLDFTFRQILGVIDTIEKAKAVNRENGSFIAPISIDPELYFGMLQNSLVLSVVMYSRPFGSNWNNAGSKLEFCPSASEKLRFIHNSVLDLRHKAIAHSDGDFLNQLESIEVFLTDQRRLGYRVRYDQLSLPNIRLEDYRMLVEYVLLETIRPTLIDLTLQLGFDPDF